MDPLTLSLLLGAGGNFLSGLFGGSQANADRKLSAEQFAKNYGLAQNAQMLSAQSQLNRAPLADKAQYLALNNAAPTPFKPRDYTQGLSQLHGTAQGGAQAQLAANNQAASNYRQGAGGVNTSALNLVMSRLGGPQSMATQTTNTVNFGGKQYTPDEWSRYLNEHPEIARTGV